VIQKARDEILGHKLEKLEFFASCYSQSFFYYWLIFKETIVFSGFKKPYKKVMER